MSPSAILFALMSLMALAADAQNVWTSREVSEKTCQITVNRKTSFFISPGYPKPMEKRLICSLRLKLSKSTRQIRLDFLNFNIAQANWALGACEKDELVVTNGHTQELRVCGSFNNRHLYFDVNDMTADVHMFVGLVDKINIDRTWMIKVTQLEPSKQAPPGCIQLYQDMVGTVNPTDFQYVGRNIIKQNNRICIQESEGICSIFYDACDGYSLKKTHSLLTDNIKVPVLAVVPFNPDASQEVVEENFLNMCITYQQEPCGYPAPDYINRGN